MSADAETVLHPKLDTQSQGWMRKTRREIHAHPELSFQETETAALVVRTLEEVGGYEIQTGVATTGVVARRVFGKGGRHIALRADMDALPLQEDSEAEYVSQVPGVAHACGHDGHVAILLTVARIMGGEGGGEGLDGELTLIFQPAEEKGGGARVMLEEEAAGNAVVVGDASAVYGAHIWTYMDVGTIGVADGPVMAYSDKFDVSVEGTGGHGATPHCGVDPIVVAGHLITALQSVVSRSVDPLEPAVLTIGFINGGTIHNVIARSVAMGGTVRCYSQAVQETVIQRMQEVVDGVGATYGATITLDYKKGYPATINAQGPTQVVAESASAVVGRPAVIPPYRTLCGEDFGYFSHQSGRDTSFFFVGGAPPESGPPGSVAHHTPSFDFDEAALDIGASIFLHIIDRELKTKQ